jgi:xanthine dehydrogenase accessory factor
VAECLCRFGATLGFRVIVDDTPTPEPARFPDATKIIGDDYDYERLTPAAGDAVVIATLHKGDHVSAVRALRSPAHTIALIASRKRSRLILDFLGGEGFTAEDLARLRAPAGLDLAAKTPEEIALSVMGEIVMLRRGGTGLPIRDKAGTQCDEPRQRKSSTTAREPADAQP